MNKYRVCGILLLEDAGKTKKTSDQNFRDSLSKFPSHKSLMTDKVLKPKL